MRNEQDAPIVNGREIFVRRMLPDAPVARALIMPFCQMWICESTIGMVVSNG
jgi:hypothetical protein